jgi:cytochrome c peroxidase
MFTVRKTFLITGVIFIFTAVAIHLAHAAQNATDQSKTLNLPHELYHYELTHLPPYYTNPPVSLTDNTPANNPITDEGATLGRVLFYDTTLSANDTIACASCHIQAYGFADPNPFSIGFAGGLTGRNSMGLSNAQYYARGHFFWDERATTLEEQVLLPIQNSVEMGLTLDELEANVSAQPYYPELFAAAFGSPEINSERISLALAQFVRSLVTYHAKYDEGLRHNFANFTHKENLGRQIFFSSNQGNCAACHTTEAFALSQPQNIGLDIDYADEGVGAITGNEADNGKFKVPSLRNIALTGPYMHDGRFETLEEVVDFYNRDIQPHPNLSPALQNRDGNPVHMHLDHHEQEALIAFLNTLTDDSFLNDPRFSNPFVPINNLNHFTYLPFIALE